MLGLRPNGMDESVFIHQLAFVESQSIGKATRVWAFAHVMIGAVVGEKCNLGEHVFVESGAKIGNGVTVKNGISIWDRVEIADDVFLGPHMIFTNDLRPRAFIKKGADLLLPTRVGKGATIGAGAVIVCGITLGEYAFVAAGSVVTRDVPAFGLVKGNPAKLTGYVCQCAETLFPIKTPAQSPLSCLQCGTSNPASL